MRISVLGAGHVGLVTASVFADLGNEVECADVDTQKIESLNNRVMPIYEPGLEEMVTRNLDENRLVFSSDVGPATEEAEVVFICVGTPIDHNCKADLSYIENAARTIGKHLNGYKIIVNKSTVPVGTGDLVRRLINESKSGDHQFDVVSNPEFQREGNAIADALNPDRIVIGAPTKKVAMKLLELYATLGASILITDVESAEMIKFASNAFLATKISFINAISDMCETSGADINDVAKGVGADKRIGSLFLKAGLGFGGSAFPTPGKLGSGFSLLNEALRINENRVKRFVQRIEDRFPDLNGHQFGVLGLAFKPDTDDMREAKSLEIIRKLLAAGASIKAYDPAAMENAKKELPEITYCQNAYDTAVDADGLIIVTEWREFKSLNIDKIKGVMKTPVVFDGRNIYDPEKIRNAGFEYISIGRS